MTTATTTATEWASFSFTFDGHEMISKISKKAQQYPLIASLSVEQFAQLNRGAMADLVGSGLTREELEKELVRVNEGCSWAIIELA